MIRWLITRLPVELRMTDDEAATIEVMSGVAARRLKVPASMARHYDGVFPITIDGSGDADALIARLDAMRPSYERRNVGFRSPLMRAYYRAKYGGPT